MRVVPSHGRGASPSSVLQLAAGVRSASIRSMASPASRVASASATRAAVGLAQELGLEREVDGAGRDVQGQLLRLEVVLEQGHRERQGDPAAEAVAGRAAASDRRRRRPAAGPSGRAPLTPNRRSIARSCPTVVDARARAPHAPASVSARSSSRSIGPKRPASRRSLAKDGRAQPRVPDAGRARKPRNATTGSSALNADRRDRRPARRPGTTAAWSATTPLAKSTSMTTGASDAQRAAARRPRPAAPHVRPRVARRPGPARRRPSGGREIALVRRRRPS